MSDETKETPEVAPAPENVTSFAQSKRKPTKSEEKRHSIFVDRMQRKVNEGKTPEQAAKEIAQEDYDRLPVEKKLDRLANLLAGATQGFKQDYMALEHNDYVLSDTMDVNFRAFGKMLAKLGLSPEQQKELMAETQAEMKAEKDALLVQQQIESLQKAAEEEKKEAVSGVDASGEPPPPPEEATSFGG